MDKAIRTQAYHTTKVQHIKVANHMISHMIPANKAGHMTLAAHIKVAMKATPDPILHQMMKILTNKAKGHIFSHMTLAVVKVCLTKRATKLRHMKQVGIASLLTVADPIKKVRMDYQILVALVGNPHTQPS